MGTALKTVTVALQASHAVRLTGVQGQGQSSGKPLDETDNSIVTIPNIQAHVLNGRSEQGSHTYIGVFLVLASRICMHSPARTLCSHPLTSQPVTMCDHLRLYSSLYYASRQRYRTPSGARAPIGPANPKTLAFDGSTGSWGRQYGSLLPLQRPEHEDSQIGNAS